MPVPSPPLEVAVEEGRTWIFVAALHWPGWCRRGRSEEAAVAELLRCAPRYATGVADRAGPAGAGFPANPGPGDLQVLARVPGTATTDFGAPDARTPADDDLDDDDAGRHVGLLQAAWEFFDAVAANAPPVLTKGPRGGGRDRDAVVGHTREAERSYARKAGVRVAPATPWPEQRRLLGAAVLSGPPTATWPLRYLIRRCAWHVVDHAWEIEDRGSRL